MSEYRLLFLANVMALVAVSWVFTQLSSDEASVLSSTNRLERCRELASEIRELQKVASDRVVIADNSFDPSVSVADAVKKASLYDGNFTTSESGMGVVEKSEARRFRISIPAYQITLPQVAMLVARLAESEMKYQTTAISLTKPKKTVVDGNGNGLERWDATFGEIVYLKKAVKKKGKR